MEKRNKIKPKTKPIKMPSYTHTDRQGMKWRMAGSRPVSWLADKVMQDCGLPLLK